MRVFWAKHRYFLVSLFIVNLVFWALLFQERSFGGDFWLHLWLIKLQEQSFTEFGLPALLASFSPAGALSAAPMFTGGISYSLAGLVGSLGASTYFAAVSFALVAFNSAFVSCYALLHKFQLSTWLKIALSYVPMTFAFPIGDGFGRGGLSSMIAGLFGVAAVCLLVHIMFSSVTRPLVIVLCTAAIVFATSTHLPSAIIFGVFSVPMLLIASLLWKERITKSGILSAAATTFSGFLISSIYLVPTLTWALQASNQATQVEPFQLGASEYFADPFYQWNLLRIVPPGHIQFWTAQTSDGGATSLITTLPTLLYLVIVVGCVISIQQKKFSLIFPSLVPLALTTILLVVPVLWTFFPYPLRSLQYSFRISYAIIPWLLICVALVLESAPARKWRTSVSAWVLLSIVICTAQSFVQLATTNSYSILPTGDTLKRFIKDVPPSKMLEVSSPDVFWYSAGEQKAVDELNANIDATGCTFLDSVEQWPSFPAVSEVIIPKDWTCAYFSMNLPVSWLNFENANVLGRDPDTLNLAIKQIDNQQPMVVSLKPVNPIYVSLVLTVIGILVMALTTFLTKRNIVRSKGQQEGALTAQSRGFDPPTG